MNMVVVIDNIRSVHNVGSIFRTADAVGAEKIYCCGITPGPIDRFNNVRADFAKISEPVLKLADQILEIPMQGKKESLNVGVAFGIVAFALRDPVLQ